MLTDNLTLLVIDKPCSQFDKIVLNFTRSYLIRRFFDKLLHSYVRNKKHVHFAVHFQDDFCPFSLEKSERKCGKIIKSPSVYLCIANFPSLKNARRHVNNIVKNSAPSDEVPKRGNGKIITLIHHTGQRVTLLVMGGLRRLRN